MAERKYYYAISLHDTDNPLTDEMADSIVCFANNFSEVFDIVEFAKEHDFSVVIHRPQPTEDGDK